MGQGHVAVEGLRGLCRLLAPGATRDGLVARWPDASVWPALVAQADAHRLLPALAATLIRHRLTDRLDDELVPLLEEVAAWNTGRNEGLRRQLLGLSRAFNGADVAPVWLKGALALLPADGPASGRMMLDLDVWVPSLDGQRRALEALERLGYGFAAEQMPLYADTQHYPAHFHPGEMARLELHRSILPARHHALLPPDAAADGIERMDWEGTRIGRLDAPSRALCALAQCARPENSIRETSEVPLMKALDFAGRIHADFGGAVPDVLTERVVQAGWAGCTRPVFTLTERYFGIPSPLPADDRLVRALERGLRHPRWNLAVLAAGSVFGVRGRSLLRDPRRIAGAVRNHLAQLRTPRSNHPVK